jgi:hypothetical protein
MRKYGLWRNFIMPYHIRSIEISANRLATAARTCFHKFKNDYKIVSFLHISEWRCYKSNLEEDYTLTTFPLNFTTIIDDTKVSIPSAMRSMDENSRSLSEHLGKLLCLSSEDSEELFHENIDTINDEDNIMLNHEILEYIAQLELPVFLSIDATLENGSAISNVSITVPDIRQTDEDQEWQHRPARIILSRAWKLPKQWTSVYQYGRNNRTYNGRLHYSIGYGNHLHY